MTQTVGQFVFAVRAERETAYLETGSVMCLKDAGHQKRRRVIIKVRGKITEPDALMRIPSASINGRRYPGILVRRVNFRADLLHFGCRRERQHRKGRRCALATADSLI